MAEGRQEAVRSDEAVVSAAEVREPKRRIRELERVHSDCALPGQADSFRSAAANGNCRDGHVLLPVRDLVGWITFAGFGNPWPLARGGINRASRHPVPSIVTFWHLNSKPNATLR